MKKITKILSVFAFIAIAFFGTIMFTGCKEKELVNFGLNKPIQTIYSLNEDINLNNAALILTYSDDSQAIITISSDMISGFDTTMVGERTLIIKYKEIEIPVDYIVALDDFDLILSTISNNLLHANQFVALAKRYDDSAIEYRDYNKYIKYETYFKDIDMLSLPQQYTIYNLANDKQYESSMGTTSSTEYTISEIYSYTYAFIDPTATIDYKKVVFENKKYKLTYKFNNGGDLLNVEVIATLDGKVESVKIPYMIEILYTYTDVPAITWPAS